MQICVNKISYPRGIQTFAASPPDRMFVHMATHFGSSTPRCPLGPFLPCFTTHTAILFLWQPSAPVACSSFTSLWKCRLRLFDHTDQTQDRTLKYRVLVPPRASLPLPPCLTDALYLINKFENFPHATTLGGDCGLITRCAFLLFGFLGSYCISEAQKVYSFFPGVTQQLRKDVVS